ncbi:MAG TPA: YdeI/OmpD-associated family protein [Pyrinomonadaceae bacterium]|jgi:bifunctional DNA-binding transcriptional regulator/antitoxin component of YhaV-PrlF toxin-antitoxin module
MSEKQTFEVLLEKDENLDATRITVPLDAEKVFGAKRVPIKLSINGADYRTTIFRMGGKYVIAVPKRFREAARVKSGEMITVEIERDNEVRVIIPPEDFAGALAENSRAKRVWEKLSYTRRREYVMAIEDAKKPETRARRIAKAIEQIAPE